LIIKKEDKNLLLRVIDEHIIAFGIIDM